MSRPNPTRVRRPFTMMELVVVLAIMAAIVGVVLPQIGRLPTGMRIETCIGTFESAFRDAALRANATGATVKLKLDSKANKFELEEIAAPPLPAVAPPVTGVASTLTSSSKPMSAPTPMPDEAPAESRYSGSKSYELPNGIEWKLDDWASDEYDAPAYTFYPNGEAAGPRLEFDSGSRRLRLDVNRLTGRPAVSEIEQ